MTTSSNLSDTNRGLIRYAEPTDTGVECCFVKNLCQSYLSLPCGRIHFEVPADEELTSHDRGKGVAVNFELAFLRRIKGQTDFAARNGKFRSRFGANSEVVINPPLQARRSYIK